MKSKLYFSIILISLFFSVCEKGNSQAPDWEWAKGIGGIAYDYGTSIVIDASGNVFTTGSFKGLVDFDAGAGIFYLSGVGTDQDIFVSKLDNYGNFIWAKQMLGMYGGRGYSIAVDESGNKYTTGYFTGIVDFDPGVGTFNLNSNSNSNYGAFISKLDNSGNFMWAKAFVGIGINNLASSNSIAVDAFGNVFTTGHFAGLVDFDPDSVGTFYLNSNYYNVFISKLDSYGNFVWAKSIEDADELESNSIALDTAGNIYNTGYFRGTVDFDPGIGIFNVTSTSNNQTDIFISKLDSSGNFIWTKVIGDVGPDKSQAIVIDRSGNIYTTGYFWGTVDFDPSPAINNLTAISYTNLFIAKLNNLGNFVWAKAFDGDGLPNSIAVDSSGNIYTTGQFQGHLDFDTDSTSLWYLSGSGFSQAFVSKSDTNGNTKWAVSVDDDSEGNSIAVDLTGNAFITGNFYSTWTFFGNNFIASSGATDIFIAKLDHNITGIEAAENVSNISLYPNPTSDLFTIILPSYENKKTTITITNPTGKIIYSTTTTAKQKIEVSTKDFSNGIYFVQIQSYDYIETKKLIVSK